MGPFHMPWVTFLALLVVLGSLVLALLWALFSPPAEDE